MKTIYLNVLLALLTINVLNAQWTWQNPSTPLSELKDVWPLNEDKVLIVGFGTKMWSTNAGIDWSYSINYNDTLNSMFFINQYTGWAVGETGKIIKTTDGGNNWYELSSGISDFLSDIFFINADYGWSVGWSGSILKTTNGGQNWGSINYGTSNLISVFFIDSLEGWACGTYGTIIHTIDGGNNWEDQISGTSNSIRSVYFHDSLHGIAVGLQYKYVTTDGGVNWSHEQMSPNFRRMRFINDEVGFTTGYPGYLYRIERNIETNEYFFSPMNVPTPYNLNSVRFLNETIGWAVGDNSTILKTTDQGYNWFSSIKSHPTTHLNNIHFYDQNYGYAVGDSGTILKSSNGGQNWNLISKLSVDPLNSIISIDTNTSISVGNGGKIYKTTNGGQSWMLKSSFTSQNLKSIHFVNSATGFIGGFGGKFLKTTNNGNNWSEISSSLIENINDIYMFDENSGWAVTYEGKIYQTTNGGLNWILISTSTYALNDLYFTDINHGWSVGNNGVFMSTTNGGINWSSQTISSADLNSVFFLDENNGWICTSDGKVLSTTNNGLGWTTTHITYNSLKSVFFKNGLGWIAGEYGSIVGTTIPPLRPLNVTAAALHTTQINLNWDIAEGNPSMYRIYRSLYPDHDYLQIDSVVHPNNQYQDRNLTPNTIYYYKITSANAGGSSDFSNVAWAKTYTAPTAPSNLKAEPVNKNQISLQWNASLLSPLRYKVFRSLNYSGGYSQIDSVVSPDTNYTDTNLDSNTWYYYYVQAVGDSGLSLVSEKDSAKTYGPPGQPSQFIASALSSSQVQLSWDSSAHRPAYYKIYRSLNSGTGFSQIDSVFHPTITYIDTALTLKTIYYYKILASNDWGVSASSVEDSAKTWGVSPTAPQNVSTQVISSTQIILKWNKSLFDPLKYRIFSSLSPGTGYTQIDSLNAADTAYTHSGLTPNTFYYYRIQAVNEWGFSFMSDEISGRTFSAPSVPAGLNANTISNVQIDLTWNRSAGNPLRYIIYRAVSYTGEYIKIDSTNHPDTLYHNFNLLPNTSYYYYVCALGDSGVSGASGIDSARTYGPPTVPTNVNVATVSSQRIDLSWNVSGDNPVRYRIFRSTNSGSDFTQIDSVSHPVHTYSSIGLAPFTTYYYKIMAVNSWGISTTSEVSTTTMGSVPAAPAGFIAQRNDVSSIYLSWNASGLYPESYRIFRSSLPSTGFAQIDSVDAAVTSFDDTDIPDRIFYYYVCGVNSYGMSPASVTDSASTMQKPLISNISAPGAVNQSALATITALITDDQAVHTARLYYKKGSATIYSYKNMNHTGNYYSENTSSDVATDEGILYYIEATDEAGNVAVSDTYSISVAFSNLRSSTVSGSAFPSGLPDGRWRLISIPGNITDRNIKNVLGSAGIPGNNRWLAYNNKLQNVSDSVFQTGRGYWFKEVLGGPAVEIVTGGGQSIGGKGTMIVLDTGWNIIGNPYSFPVPVQLSQTQFTGPIEYSGQLQELEGWSDVVDTLKPFGGYAVENKTSGFITIWLAPYGNGTLDKESMINYSAKTKLLLNIFTKTVNHKQNYADLHNQIGVVISAADTNYSSSEPPTAGDHISLSFSNKKLNREFLPDNSEGYQWDMQVNCTIDRSDIELGLESLHISGSEVVRVIDLSRNKIVNFNEGNYRYYQNQKGISKFKIIAGSQSYVEKTIKEIRKYLPQNLCLYQNYPNPFNPVTSIRYDLPQQSRVNLTIYNTLGQEVAHLLSSQVMETGQYSIPWNSKDNSGHQVSSGVYIYHLLVEGIDGKKYMLAKKLLLLK